MKMYPQKTGALCANSHPGSYTGQDAFNDMLPVYRRIYEMDIVDRRIVHGPSGGCDIDIDGEGLQGPSNYSGGGTEMCEIQNERKYVLRRLTPTECARLQGFPDWWVDGTEGSDSAVYKMWGNGIALPCAADVIGRLVKEIQSNEPMRDV